MTPAKRNQSEAWRDEKSARLVVECLDECDGKRALVIEDSTGQVEAALNESGAEVVCWKRRLANASAWPEDGPFDIITLRQPRSRDELMMLLHAATSRLREDGTLLIHGANDEGIRSAPRPVETLFDSVESVATRWHCRVVSAMKRKTEVALRDGLVEWRQMIEATVGARAMTWASYPGVFAHGRLDEGTRLLLEAIEESPDVRSQFDAKAHVLDFGCGAGAITMELLRQWPGMSVDMLDCDAIAIEAAKENAPNARAIVGDGLAGVGESRYDVIVSNPPLHRGKDRTFDLLRDLIAGARERLSRNGRLLFITQGAAPGARMLDAVDARHEIVADDGRFRVWSALFPFTRKKRAPGRGRAPRR